jgi:very-short-patch-repair endonuclease
MESRELDATIVRIALANHNVITTDQATGEGISYVSMLRRCDDGLLDHVDRNIFRLRASASTWDQRALVACHAAGPTARLSHRASSMLWGLDGYPAAPIELSTERWARPRRRPGVIVHESLALSPIDRTIRHGLPVTTVVRTLLDLPAVSPVPRVEQAWEDALRKQLCTPEQLVQRFVQIAKRGRRGVKVSRELLEQRTGMYVPTGSVLELKTVRLIESLGIPMPQRQVPVAIDGTTVFLDLAWLALKIGLECDGMWNHATNVQLPWDASRQNQLTLRNWLILRFSWKAVTTTPDAICDEILHAYRQRERLLRTGKAFWLD